MTAASNMLSEIYCKRCLHHDVLARPAQRSDVCPQCGAAGGPQGLHVRVMRVGPTTHFLSVLRAIFSLRGVFFLIAFAMIGTVPIGALAAGSVLLLYLGGLRLALNSMQVERADAPSKGAPRPLTTKRIQFPEVSPEELLDKSSLLPALLFVLVFVWAPPILIGFAATGLVTFDPASLVTSPKPAASKAATPDEQSAVDEKALADAMKSLGLDDPAMAAQVKQAAQAEMKHADAKHEEPHLDAPRIACGALGVLLFLWSPMAIVLFLRNPSVTTMFHARAGLATLGNDPLGYLVLSMFVLPAVAARFGADLLTAIGPFLLTPAILWAKGALVLFAWGICGLYVRKRARAYDLPVDDGDWQPLG